MMELYRKARKHRFDSYKSFIEYVISNDNDIWILSIPFFGWISSIIYFGFYLPLRYIGEYDVYHKKVRNEWN